MFREQTINSVLRIARKGIKIAAAMTAIMIKITITERGNQIGRTVKNFSAAAYGNILF